MEKTTREVKWGKNSLTFIQDANNSEIYHCQHFSINAALLNEEPKEVFRILLKRGWIKPSEIKL